MQQEERPEHQARTPQHAHTAEGGKNALADGEDHGGDKADGDGVTAGSPDAAGVVVEHGQRIEQAGHNQPDVCDAKEEGEGLVDVQQLCGLGSGLPYVQGIDRQECGEQQRGGGDGQPLRKDSRYAYEAEGIGCEEALAIGLAKSGKDGKPARVEAPYRGHEHSPDRQQDKLLVQHMGQRGRVAVHGQMNEDAQVHDERDEKRECCCDDGQHPRLRARGGVGGAVPPDGAHEEEECDQLERAGEWEQDSPMPGGDAAGPAQRDAQRPQAP